MPELIRPSYSPRKDQLFAQLLAQGQPMPLQPMPQPQGPQLAQMMAAQQPQFRPRYAPDRRTYRRINSGQALECSTATLRGSQPPKCRDGRTEYEQGRTDQAGDSALPQGGCEPGRCGSRIEAKGTGAAIMKPMGLGLLDFILFLSRASSALRRTQLGPSFPWSSYRHRTVVGGCLGGRCRPWLAARCDPR